MRMKSPESPPAELARGPRHRVPAPLKRRRKYCHRIASPTVAQTERTRLKRLLVKLIVRQILIGLLFQLIHDQVRATAGAETDELAQLYPVATLPKFGQIRGLRFASNTPKDIARDKSNSSENSPDGRREHRTVAAFLGVPYATPPTGSLRFMPPGAARPGGQRSASTARECRHVGSASPTLARPHASLGPECVRLSDWLQTAHEPASAEDQTATGRRRRRERQAENCLNANIFVPYDSIQSSRLQEAPEDYANARQQQEAVDASRRQRSGRSTAAVAKDSISRQQDDPQDRQRDSQATCHLEPLVGSSPRGTHQHPSRRKLPVLVLFHSDAADETAAAQSRLDAAVELARRAQSIVITFNHRIGLLGYLPYIDDLEDQSPSSSSLVSSLSLAAPSSGASSAGPQARSNHAIWDQMGLLHWLRHNVANFNGDPTNVTLASTDSKSAQLLQVLALSPIARGLFQRLALFHDSRRAEDSASGQYLDQLVRLALKSRELKRRLINELGLIVRRLTASEGNAPSHNAHNLDTDRNVFEFLRVANLSQLAAIEAELSRLTVGDERLRLLDFLAGPNLDDKLLFPYFAHLIRVSARMGLSTTLIGHRDLFWSSLTLSSIVALNGSSSALGPDSLASMEFEYCLYMGRLYERLYDSPSDNRTFSAADLDEIDPIKLVPRASDEQSGERMPSNKSASGHTSSWSSWFGTSGSVKSDDRPGEGDEQAAEATRLRWSQHSRQANAIEFYHLRRAHLLSQLLVQRINGSLETNSQEAADALTTRPSESDDEDEESLARKQQRSIMLMQQHQRLAGTGNSAGLAHARIKRDTLLDQLLALQEQLLDQMGAYDLLVGLGELAPSSWSTSRRSRPASSNISLIDQIAPSSPNEQRVFWLKLADLHYLAASSRARRQLGSRDADSCDHLTGDKLGKFKKGAELAAGARNRRSSYVFLSLTSGGQEFDWLASDETLESLAEFLWFGEPPTSQAHPWRPYDSLNRHIKVLSQNLAPAAALSGSSQVAEEVRVQLDLVPYLTSALKLHSSPSSPVAPPSHLAACLNELEFQAKQLVELANSAKFGDELHCLGQAVKRLRNQLRWGASRELEPLALRLLGLDSPGDRQSARPQQQRSKQLAAIRSQWPHVSSMTTRNLVNQTEAMLLDQLEPQLSDQQPADATKPLRSADQSGQIKANTTNMMASPTGKNATAGSAIRGFLAKTYKDAMGQALAIVVGTGALIFMLNLMIVIVIAIRSARANGKRRGGVQDVDQAGQQLDCLAAAQDALRRDFTPKSSLSSSRTSKASNGFGSIDRTANAGEASKQLATSSFRGRTEHTRLSSATSESGGQQPRRASRSIKFDLPAGDQLHSRAPHELASQLGKQCAFHAKGGAAEPPDASQAARYQALHSPPAYLMQALSDELELEAESANEEPDELEAKFHLLQANPSGPIYLTHQSQLVEQFDSGGTCARHHKHHFNQSLGSSSLTSPFASQSTPSNSTGAIYTVRPAAGQMHTSTAASAQSPSSSATLSTCTTPIQTTGPAQLIFESGATLTRHAECKHHLVMDSQQQQALGNYLIYAQEQPHPGGNCDDQLELSAGSLQVDSGAVRFLIMPGEAHQQPH